MYNFRILIVIPLIAGYYYPTTRTLPSSAPFAALPTGGTAPIASNSSRSATLNLPPSRSQSNYITSVPAARNQSHYNYQGLGSCTLGYAQCSSLGVRLDEDEGPAMKELPDECILWDDTCTGNRDTALKEFFGDTKQNLTQEICFLQGNDTICNYRPPGQDAAYAKFRDWMRSPQCVSAAHEYGEESHENASSMLEAIGPESPGSCCGKCSLGVQNVDIFYWPEPNANTSCLDIVGDAVNPLGLGATTAPGPGMTYWGCVPKTPLTVENAQLAIGGPPGAVDIVQSTITTAVVEEFGGVKFKAWVANPWSADGCDYDHSVFKNLTKRRELEPIRARGRPIPVNHITKRNNGSPVTATSGSFTLYVSCTMSDVSMEKHS